MTTRRSIVTGALAATLPATAIAAPAAVDPIYAAIEAHKPAWQIYLEAHNKAEALRNYMRELEEATDQPCEDAGDKIYAVMETNPTTRDGIVAWIDYIMAGYREGYVPECSETDADAFLIRVRDAIAKLA
jgi:hypothetical protein